MDLAVVGGWIWMKWSHEGNRDGLLITKTERSREG